MRLNRVQPDACRAALADAFGEAVGQRILADAGIADLPALLPAGPRDFDALAAELHPFVRLYRELEQYADHETALAMTRRAIVDSGLISHAADAEPESAPTSGQLEPLTLTSPPATEPHNSTAELQARFELSMEFFSCEGILFSYTPERVHFHVTECNWCRAMQAAGTPELIPFFCETDEHFMDAHPTHRLVRPAAIGLGYSHCDFQFIPHADKEPQP